MKRTIIIGLLAAMLMLSGCWITLTDGKHNGQITATENSGLFWKTNTLYIKSDISSSQEESYCVEDPEVLAIAQQASKERRKVTLNYHAEFITAPWRCAGEQGIVDSIDVEP